MTQGNVRIDIPTSTSGTVTIMGALALTQASVYLNTNLQILNLDAAALPNVYLGHSGVSGNIYFTDTAMALVNGMLGIGTATPTATVHSTGGVLALQGLPIPANNFNVGFAFDNAGSGFFSTSLLLFLCVFLFFFFTSTFLLTRYPFSWIP